MLTIATMISSLYFWSLNIVTLSFHKKGLSHNNSSLHEDSGGILGN
jgi:hypothetical protein